MSLGERSGNWCDPGLLEAVAVRVGARRQSAPTLAGDQQYVATITPTYFRHPLNVAGSHAGIPQAAQAVCLYMASAGRECALLAAKKCATDPAADREPVVVDLARYGGRQ